jgi:hypothetical protein
MIHANQDGVKSAIELWSRYKEVEIGLNSQHREAIIEYIVESWMKLAQVQQILCDRTDERYLREITDIEQICDGSRETSCESVIRPAQ